MLRVNVFYNFIKTNSIKLLDRNKCITIIVNSPSDEWTIYFIQVRKHCVQMQWKNVEDKFHVGT